LGGAETRRERAMASYELGVFHDNNGREDEAIPLLRLALELGLSQAFEARAHAWLASSLYKTDRPGPALDHVRAARKRTREPMIQDFLNRLEPRVARKLSAKRDQRRE
jgi:hypothetical protein